ncbi:MAG TPA: hypothetical protein VL966_00180 [Alphaproteobacteria bacterium]|nr:hypothetical protein [Alphaproteobacteria bacterium]
MHRTNVVSLPVAAPHVPSPEPVRERALNVFTFPVRRREPQVPVAGTPDSVAWALEVVTRDRNLADKLVAARRRLNSLVRETLPKPVFVPAGAGYEDVTVLLAREILQDRFPDYGPAEEQLADSVDAHYAACKQWDAAYRQLVVTCGIDALGKERDTIRDDAFEAYEVLRVHGIDRRAVS